jgi:hypothetical protein
MQPIILKYKDFEILYDLFFHQIDLMNMYVTEQGVTAQICPVIVHFV